MISVVFGVYYFIDKVANKYRWGTRTAESAVENTANNKITEEQAKTEYSASKINGIVFRAF